ncbi:MAG: Trk system potassium transporter TrkA [Rhodospirillaceae bacterium]|nr:Trk system potassium transporter TrkA [Rhodospirillaceae bacterium]|tara:strand:- start:375 stop:1751 length:1377 start_codon:yes stop_codon:yes gene_type:complete
MRIIVCGAGQVGSSIARQLAGEANDVTLIDHDAEIVRKRADTLDVRCIHGNASLPDVLADAGAKSADMLIAVTFSDEVNMIACQVGHSIFGIPEKIARVRHQSYLDRTWVDLYRADHMPIDLIISPEIEVARAIERRLEVPGALDMLRFGDDKLRVISIRCEEKCPVINTPLRQLTEIFPELNIVVLGIRRSDKLIVPRAEDQMLIGDEVYFVCDAQHTERALAVFGHEEPGARRVVIVGGGNIGLYLARDLEKHHSELQLKIIEVNHERAKYLADELSRTTVIHGSALDPEILSEVNIGLSEAMITVSNDDEVNILSSLLAKRAGCKLVMTLVNNPTYAPLLGDLGVDVAVSPRESTVSTILQRIRRGRIIAVHSVQDGLAEIVEAEAMETSPLVGKPISEVKLPSGILIGAILRKDLVIIPRSDTIIEPHDRVITFVAAGAVRKLEKLFAVSLEYF